MAKQQYRSREKFQKPQMQMSVACLSAVLNSKIKSARLLKISFSVPVRMKLDCCTIAD